MERKLCCGIYDYDGVLVPGEELMDQYIDPVCHEATNAYGLKLFKRQLELLLEKQRLEEERNIYDPDYKTICQQLIDIEEKIKKHFELKDRVLEETEPKFKNIIDYDEIYRIENVYPGVLNSLLEIYKENIYQKLVNNTHVNIKREIVAKERLLKAYFPPMEFVPIPFHIFPYRDKEGYVNKDRKPTDKVLRMMRTIDYVNPLISTYVDNSRGVILCANKQGFRTYFVDKNQNPNDSIILAANDTIDIVHGGKIKKLSL